MHNITTEERGEININNNYTVTEKADGIRKLLYVDDTGKVYLINSNMQIQYSGMKTEEKGVLIPLSMENILFIIKIKNILIYTKRLTFIL